MATNKVVVTASDVKAAELWEDGPLKVRWLALVGEGREMVRLLENPQMLPMGGMHSWREHIRMQAETVQRETLKFLED